MVQDVQLSTRNCWQNHTFMHSEHPPPPYATLYEFQIKIYWSYQKKGTPYQKQTALQHTEQLGSSFAVARK